MNPKYSIKKKISGSIFLISISLTFSGYSQGLKNLDNSFGIDKFKLNTSYNIHKNHLKYYDTNTEGVEFYDYTKGDIIKLFGQSVSRINLGYINDNLYLITISFGSLDKRQNMMLLQKLRDLFSTPEIIQPNNHLVFVAKWETGKIYMQAEEYSCSSPVFPCETELFIYSKELKKTLR